MYTVLQIYKLTDFFLFSDWLTPFSMAVSNFLCPLIVGICRRKSTRLTAVTGGLVTALGCLFTSFATQFHQLFFSYGFMMGKKENNHTIIMSGKKINILKR